ncbi:MAG: hypothetical protein Q9225_003583 [Loekoesia sp. 1 TL-2023]
MPHLQYPVATPQTRGWQPLQDSSSNPALPLNIYVPDPPTPRSQQLGNDTPTPAEQTPGSWRERRRTGELVERPPKLRLNPPDSTLSTSPEIQPSPEEQSTSTAEPESLSQQTYATPPELRGSSSSSSAGSEKHQHSQSDPEDPLPPPPLAKVASHHNQLDGASDEVEARRAPKSRSSCQNSRGSLKSLPLQLKDLFSKEKTSHSNGSDSAKTKSLTQCKENQTWWSKTTGRFRKRKGQENKPVPGRAGQKSARNSLRHLFSSSAAPEQRSRESSSGAPPGMNPLAAPQAFGASTYEEDTSSAMEPELSSEEKEAMGREIMRQRLEAAKAGAERRRRERETEQTTSGQEAVAGTTLDGSPDQNDRTQPRQDSGSSLLRKAYRQWEAVVNWSAMP